jgi:polar amino acid transport system substrate-binding protein
MLPAAAIVVLVAAGAYFALNYRRGPIENRVYRIGWQQVPPFQYKTEDGSPTGLAVELVRDAARRRGIQLEWVLVPGSSETALRNGEVDLWPLLTITPERKRQKAIYISKPYLQHDHNLLVLVGSRYSQIGDMASALISYPGLPIAQQLLRRVLPNARLVAVASEKDAVENVCSGRTDAVFSERVQRRSGLA